MDEKNYQIIIRKIEKYLEKYKLKEEKLYWLKSNNKELLIIRRNEIEPILSLVYKHLLSRYFRLETTLTKLKERYYWSKMRNNIKSYIYTCDQYQRHGKTIDKNKLHLIRIKKPFNNQIIEKLLEWFKIRHNLSTLYHLKTNRLVEKFNRTLCESLAKLNKEKKNWNKYISLILFAYKTKVNKST